MPRAPTPALLLLALGQTVAWSALYYLFAALLLPWERSTGWSKPDIALALTLALLASGLVSPLIGRLIDRGHGPLLMGAGTALGGLTVACLPFAESLTAFQALWVLIGICQAAALYEPCFALLSRAMGPEARRGITLITLIAGFASAVSFGGASLLVGWGGWEMATHFFGMTACLIAAPASYLGARLLQAPANRPSSADETNPETPLPATDPAFLLVAAAFPLMALNHGILVNHLLPILDERGVPSALAVLAASLIGPMQVAGRAILMLAGGRLASLGLTMVSFAGVAVATLLLLASGATPGLILAAVTLQGATYGLISILKPVVITELL
ncbi:MAG: MFS transporter, partial [Pseudomonadota bacterium]